MGQAMVKLEQNDGGQQFKVRVTEVILDPGAGGGDGNAHPISQPDGQHSSMNVAGSLETADLADLDKKGLLDQITSERQKNASLQLQIQVMQLKDKVGELEQLSKDREQFHLETLALAEAHHKENILGEVGRLLEAELSCSICNEVYIEPASLACGHTYCSYCINRALRVKLHCPICRSANRNPPAKSVEMRNCINKLLQMLPQELRTNREEVTEERAADALMPASVPAAVLPEMGGSFARERFEVQVGYGSDSDDWEYGSRFDDLWTAFERNPNVPLPAGNVIGASGASSSGIGASGGVSNPAPNPRQDAEEPSRLSSQVSGEDSDWD